MTDAKEVVHGILTRYAERYILPRILDTEENLYLLFLEKYYKLLIEDNIRLEEKIEKKLYGYLEGLISHLISINSSFLVFLKFLVYLGDVYKLEPRKETINSILEIDKKTSKLRIYEITRVYYIM